MALACLACHAMDNSTDSFRMDRSFRMQNMSVRSIHSDDGQEGCAGVSGCFSKQNKTAPHNDRQQQHRLGGIMGGRTLRNSSSPSSNVPQRGGSLSSFGRQADDSLDRMVFPEPRLTRCHAVRRDIFSNWTVGEIETEFGGRQLCFNLSSTTA